MRFPADFHKGVILVPVLITGPARQHRIRLVLDTGASRTVISRELMSALGYDVPRSTRSLRLMTASGELRVPIVSAQQVAALGHRVESMDVLCHTIPESTGADGLLGLDFFRGRRLVVDFRQANVFVD